MHLEFNLHTVFPLFNDHSIHTTPCTYYFDVQRIYEATFGQLAALDMCLIQLIVTLHTLGMCLSDNSSVNDSYEALNV